MNKRLGYRNCFLSVKWKIILCSFFCLMLLLSVSLNQANAELWSYENNANLNTVDLSATGGAPLLSSSVGGSTNMYQAVFFPRNNNHWTGDLKKYVFDPDAGDAGEYKLAPGWVGSADSLKVTSPVNRKIYFSSFGGISNDKNNLALLDWSLINDSSNLSELSGRAGLTNSQDDLSLNDDSLAINYQKRFFQWFRGYGEDVFDDSVENGRVDKLFDIFHSGMVLVGAPSAGITDQEYAAFLNQDIATDDGTIKVKERKSMVYLQSNAGLLHAFKDMDGIENWAFLAPNVLEKARLRGLKWRMGKSNFEYLIPQINPSGTLGWDFEKEGEFIPRYIADGPVLAEDVLFDGEDKYRTVLFVQLGFGGAGMYLLDVTNPDSPQFVWAVENDFEPKTQTGVNNDSNGIKVWYQSGDKKSSIDGYNGYSSLRKTGSSGFLGFVKTNEDGIIKRNWAFLMGNGSDPGGVSNFRGEVYLGRVKDGSIVKRYLVPQGSGGQTNAVIVTPVAVPLSDEAEPEPRHIQRFYVGDDQGRIFKVEIGDVTFEEKDQAVNIPEAMYSMGGVPGFSYTLDVATLEPENGINKREDWLYLGTGDLEKYAVTPGDNIKQNYFFALNATYPEKVTNLATRLPEAPISIRTEKEIETEIPVGWKKTFDYNKGNPDITERLTTAPVVYNGYVYFGTTITQYNKDGTINNTGKVYSLDARTGQTIWEHSIANSIISGVSIAGGRLAVGISFGSDQKNLNKDIAFSIDGFRLLGNNILYSNKPLPGTEEFEDPAGKFRNMTPLYWKTR